MMNLSLSIRNKLLLGFFGIVLMFGMTNGIAYLFIKQLNDSYAELLEKRVIILANAKEIQSTASQEIAALRAVLLAEANSASTVNDAIDSLDAMVKQTAEMGVAPEEQTLLESLQRLNDQFKEKAAQVEKLMGTNEWEDAKRVALNDAIPVSREIRNLANLLVDNEKKLMEEETLQNSELVEQIRNTIELVSLAAIAAAIIVGFWLSRHISRPIAQLTAAAERVAAGDLTVAIGRIKNRDELGKLAQAFTQMVQNLRTLVTEVVSNAEQVAASSEQLTASAEETTQATNQIASAIQGVAHGAEVQGRSVDDSVRLISEMNLGVQRVAETASTVAEVSIETSKETERGNEMIRKVIDQMQTISAAVAQTDQVVKRLGQRSKQIDEIIQVITDISDQTNLLALNAAIEAARAGEHGKGFAVVADEVRKLAEQSKNSAEQIANLIRQIQADTSHAVSAMEQGQKEVETGRVIVEETGVGFQRIFHSVEQTSTQIQEVTAVAEEMTASSEQIKASIEEMARIAEESAANSQNVASVSEEQLASMEEIAASAGSLEKMAEELRTLVSRFRVS
ncbi:methyl-accepting chemotaxis protein [Brevibacillus borstelensis]|uniref:methyl-accepting chemotaxis protein n=1 Tax=Brevibacillus borstelensis TaxID=45462 RepID=UPI0030EE465D